MIRDLSAWALLCLFAIMPSVLHAQVPVAQINASNTSGCSPVVVQFSDQSTGSPTFWSWDLGNGGTSTLQNPAATYITPGTYTVILTATNANGSTKDTSYITVFASPVVNFTSDTVTACGSKTVQFTNLTTPGETGVTSYLWDFGDGDSSTAVNPSHTYTYPSSFAVSLVVTNSKGCTKSITKTSYVNVIGKPATAFAANQTSGCNAPFTVTFSNTTTNAVSYQWSFGDGVTSTATTPTHTYNTPGTYTVRLISTGSNGCKDTLTKTSYISIGQVTASFTNSLACEGAPTVFTNTTTPGLGISRSWSFGTSATDTAAHPSYTYNMAGNYSVTLIETYANNCSDTITKTVTVLPKPNAGFTTADTVACTVPFSASFSNTSTGATSYAWSFNPGTSTSANPSHSFTSMGLYNVTLVATSAGGCKDTFTKNNAVKIQEPVATLSASPTAACINRNINFTGSVATPLYATNYRWDFGDGSAIVNCASCKTQSHAYSATGTYIVKLIVTTTSGCYDTVTRTITIDQKPAANFSGTPTTVCPHQTVSFTNNSTGASAYIWKFGDGHTTTTTSPGHPYNSPGSYDVTLIAVNGGCRDTMKKPAYVTVQLPLANFKDSFLCGNKLTHYFVDSSVGGNTYSWDFGDGNTSTTTGSVSHTYASSGVYKVVLRVVNTASGCEDTITRTVNTNPIPLPTYTVNDSAFCVGETFGLTRTSGNSAYKYAVHFGSSVLNNQSTYLFWHTSQPGIYDVKIVVSDSFGCKDSIYRPNFVKVGKTSANFTVSNQTPCKETTIIFDENSVEGPFPVVTRIWSFGDGTQETRTSDTIWHKYNNTGPYNVKLLVIDANGCVDSITKNNNVYVYKPVAQFYSNDTIICVGDTVKFNNNSGGANFISAWTFGDGGTSSVTAPEHIYNAFGQYTVKLVLTDMFGCKDSAIKNNYIKVEKPTAAFSLSDTLGACPPLTVYTTNNTAGSNTYTWSFGNNNQSSNTNPSITYTYPGTYTIKLIATNAGGCKDSTTRNVQVNGPTGTYTYSPLNGCDPLTVQFTATSNNTSVYIWDMNNGVTQNTNTGSFSYTFTQSGKYVPKLILSDGASCQVPLQKNDTVTVDHLAADFSFSSVGNLCNTDTVYFNDTVFESYSGIASRSWIFGDGGTSTAEDPAHYYSTPGTYQVKLVIGNANGCNDTITKPVIVRGLPQVQITAASDSLCPGQPTGIQLEVNGAATYSWTPVTGLSCSTCDNPIANPQVTTTYIVTGTDTNGCTANDTITIGIKDKPVVTISADTTVCIGLQTVLQATGATTYTWNPSTGLSCNNCPAPLASPVANTTYTVIGTNISGCKDTASVNITVQAQPVVTTNTVAPLCVGDTANLMAGGATTYTWTPTASLSCATCATTTAYPAATTVYTVVGTDGNGCKDTANTTVTVNSLPVVNAGADKAICAGTTVALQATGATNYTWTPTAGLSCTNCAAPAANPVSTTTYIVTGTNGSACSSTDTVEVKVNALPVVSAGTDKEICAGNNVVLQATGAGNYTWTPATGLSCTNCTSPTASPTTTTVYTVTGVDGNGCSDTGVVTVTVNALPTVDAGTDKSICPADSVQLTATGAVTYSWTPTNGLSCVGCSTPKASPSATTTYTVTGTDAKGCQNTATVKVNLNTTPVVSAGSNKTICVSDTVTLQATGAAAYTWSPATGLSCTNCASPKASPSSTTVYTVIGANGSSCKDTATVTVTVNPLPVVSAGADKSVCSGSSVAIQATGAATYTWSPATGLSCTNCAGPTATPSATTIYTVTGTDANGCIDTAAVKVNVNPLPNVNAGGNKTVCLGDSVQLQATGAVVYSWSPATGLSCNNCANPKAAPSATTVYTVTGTDANGCQNTSTVTVNVNALPTISATNQTICSGSSVQLQATGAVSYIWTPATGLSCTNCPNPNANPTTTTVYTITGTDANGCKADGQVTVSVNALPAVSAGNNVDICSADSAQLQASGAATYTWSPATGLSCTNCANPKASPAATTVYTVTGTDANGCVNTSTVTVTVKPLPTVSAGSDAAICVGNSVTLSASGAATYIWSPATGLSCTNCTSPVASPAVTTTYVAKGTAANGCSANDTVVVTVHPLPIVSAGANAAICENDSLKLQATGATNYTWSPSTGLSCTTCPDPYAKPAITTTYTLIGTNANNCKDTAQVTITVKPLPVVAAIAARTIICSGDTTQLSATGATGGYTWSPATGLNCTNCANPIAKPANTMTYIVTGVENGCTDTAHITVNTFAKPNVSAGNDTGYCIGGSGTLHATGATNYAWSPANGLSCTNCANPAVNVGSTTTYTVTGTDDKGCVNTDNIVVTVNPLPNVSAGDDKEVCEGDSVQLLAQGAASYVWSPANGLSCTTCPDPMATTTSKATFMVTGTDVNGCVNSDDITITQLDKRPVYFSADDSICVGESLELFAEGGTEYLWTPADGISNNSGNYKVAPLVTTQYTVIVKQGICFADTGKITVHVFKLPEIDAGEDKTLSGSNEIRLEPRSTGVMKYEWSPAESLSCTDCSNPRATPFVTTTYHVKATSAFGCVAEDDVTIKVTCGVNQIFIANTFTPNNDGVNDVFFPQGKGLKVLSRFSVYNRWGELLFDVKDMPLNDPTYGWDGTYKSEPLKPDVFVYIIRAICEDGNPVELKGDISLIR